MIKAIVIAGNKDQYQVAIQERKLSSIEHVFANSIVQLEELPKPIEVFFCGDWWKNPIMEELSIEQVNKICAVKKK